MRVPFFEGQYWYGSVLLSALVLGALVSMPYVLHILDDRYQGVSVHFNADEFSYMPRVQQVLIGHPEEMGVAVTGGQKLPVLQPALIEDVYGTVFRFFGVKHASTVFTVMDFFVPFFLFIVLVGFLRSCGLSRKQSWTAAVLFSALQLYSLNRPVHQGASFLLSILAMWGIIEGVERRMFWGFLGGALMGILVGVYFWSWTYVWCWFGLLVIYVLLSLCAGKLHIHSRTLLAKLFMFGLFALIVALPFFWQTYQVTQYPLFTEAFFRSGMGKSHIPESWPWTLLFAVMAVGMIILWQKRRRDERMIYAVCTVVTAFVVLNQHIIHGTRFLFASHYLMFLVFAGVITLIHAWSSIFPCHSELYRRTQWKNVFVFFCVLLFLFGIAYDNRSLIAQWRIDADDFEEQHLASVLPILDVLDRAVILSDPQTSSFIASHTQHDVLFTHYVQHQLLSHQEIAERYCLTQIALLPKERRPEDELVLVYGAAYDAIFDLAERQRVRTQELKLVSDVCTEVDLHVADFLKHYGVQYILWDQKRHPQWRIERLGLRLKQMEKGEEWRLWKL